MNETMNCKICDDPGALSGTKLCNRCWSALRSGDPMLESLGVDIEIKLCTSHYEFRWSVDLMTDDITYGFSAESLEDALAGAAERLRSGV